MIIDSPINFGLGSGQDRIIPQEDDARIVIPNTILPTIKALQPQQIGIVGDAAVRRVFSTIAQITQLRGPSSTSLIVGLMTLGKGYWSIRMEMAWQADFAGTAAAPVFIAVNFSSQGQSLSLLNVPLAVIGGGVETSTYEMLLTGDSVIAIQTPATGVAQNLMARLTVNASKLL